MTDSNNRENTILSLVIEYLSRFSLRNMPALKMEVDGQYAAAMDAMPALDPDDQAWRDEEDIADAKENFKDGLKVHAAMQVLSLIGNKLMKDISELENKIEKDEMTSTHHPELENTVKRIMTNGFEKGVNYILDGWKEDVRDSSIVYKRFHKESRAEKLKEVMESMVYYINYCENGFEGDEALCSTAIEIRKTDNGYRLEMPKAMLDMVLQFELGKSFEDLTQRPNR